MQEITYEGYGPGGVACVIDTFTDNKNRTSQSVRNILRKFGGTLAGAGATSFLFEMKGVIDVAQKAVRDEDELQAIDAGACDIQEGPNGLIVYTAPGELTNVKKALQERGFNVLSAELCKVPKNFIEVKDAAVAQKLLDLVDALEDEDDVSNVAVNFEIAS